MHTYLCRGADGVRDAEGDAGAVEEEQVEGGEVRERDAPCERVPLQNRVGRRREGALETGGAGGCGAKG